MFKIIFEFADVQKTHGPYSSVSETLDYLEILLELYTMIDPDPWYLIRRVRIKKMP